MHHLKGEAGGNRPGSGQLSSPHRVRSAPVPPSLYGDVVDRRHSYSNSDDLQFRLQHLGQSDL